jgi:hypothetical protein
MNARLRTIIAQLERDYAVLEAYQSHYPTTAGRERLDHMRDAIRHLDAALAAFVTR